MLSVFGRQQRPKTCFYLTITSHPEVAMNISSYEPEYRTWCEPSEVIVLIRGWLIQMRCQGEGSVPLHLEIRRPWRNCWLNHLFINNQFRQMILAYFFWPFPRVVEWQARFEMVLLKQLQRGS